ncbi:MAG: hypothetical protein JNL88_10260 [Bacteroidia bacterium]|nr:hypothetical protein [Bacteroidia bacterium]
MDRNHLHTNQEDELKEAPLLKSMQGRDGFRAPDGYFESLTSSIQDRIHSERPEPRFSFLLRPAMAGFGFALLLLIAGLAYFNLRDESTAPQQVSAENELSVEDVIESGYYLELDDDLIAESFNTAATSSDTSHTVQERQVEEYFLQSADESLLLNEL